MAELLIGRNGVKVEECARVDSSRVWISSDGNGSRTTQPYTWPYWPVKYLDVDAPFTILKAWKSPQHDLCAFLPFFFQTMLLPFSSVYFRLRASGSCRHECCNVQQSSPSPFPSLSARVNWARKRKNRPFLRGGCCVLRGRRDLIGEKNKRNRKDEMHNEMSDSQKTMLFEWSVEATESG